MKVSVQMDAAVKVLVFVKMTAQNVIILLVVVIYRIVHIVLVMGNPNIRHVL